MAVRSSISSSEKSFPEPGRPGALIAAVMMVALLEIVLRLLPAGSQLGYGFGMAAYSDVRHTIEEMGTADIAVLGTSRGRESIVAPLLKDLVAEQLGRSVTVGNYSCPGSLADEMLVIAQSMTASKIKPQVVLYFASPSLFAGESRWQRLEILGVYHDQGRGRTGQLLMTWLGKPFWDLRNWLEHHYLTFRRRHRFRHLVMSSLRGRAPVSAVQGDYTSWQLYAAQRSLVTHPVGVQRIRNYVAPLLDEEGIYKINERQLDAFAETVRILQDQGVSVVILEAPLSEDLAAQMPDQLKDTFSAAVAGVAERQGLVALTMQDIEAGLMRADFREQSHLNRSGGGKITRALMKHVIEPLLRIDPTVSGSSRTGGD